MRNRILKSFVALVDLAAVAALFTLPATGLRNGLATLFVLLAVSAVLGLRPVRIPGLKVQIVVLEPLVFAGLLLLPPLAAPLVALAALLGVVLGPRRRPVSIRTAFNLGALPLSAALAALAFSRMAAAGEGLAAGVALPLAVAALVFYLANTGLAAIAIALENGHGLFHAWRRSGAWTVLSCLTSVVLAAGLFVTFQTLGPAVLLLGLVISRPLSAYESERGRRVARSLAS